VLCAALIIAYIKIKSTEGVTITTKEFKIFQSNFLIGTSAMILCELLCTASFFHTFITLKLNLEQITKLYITTIVSTTGFGVIYEIFDIGSRKDKCILSALLYSVSMLSIFFGNSRHFGLLLLGRVLYGSASALHHSSFESYVIYEHTTLGFPDDWLTQTFILLTHSMALVAVLAGTIGQSISTSGSLGVITFCCVGFALTALYIMMVWKKDSSGKRFLLSSFIYNVNQTFQASRTNKSTLLFLTITALFESSISIFTFYWAPLIYTMSNSAQSIPYEIIFSTYVCASMLGNYLYQLFSSSYGTESAFQIILLGSALSYVIGSVIQTQSIAFTMSVVLQAFVGGYWPCVGFLRGRCVSPECRTTSLTLVRIVSLLISVSILSFFHHSPFLTLSCCGLLTGTASYLQNLLTQVSIIYIVIFTIISLLI
jgi:hypothetical protein